MRRPLPIRIIRRLERHPLAVLSVASFGIRVGKDALRLRQGEFDSKEFRARAGGHVGAVSGSALGWTAGALAGRLIPGPLGMIVGGFAGGMIGEFSGQALGRKAAEGIESRVQKEEPPKKRKL